MVAAQAHLCASQACVLGRQGEGGLGSGARLPQGGALAGGALRGDVQEAFSWGV